MWCIEYMGWDSPFSLSPWTLTWSLNIKPVCIGNLMLLCFDSERSVSASSLWIFRLSMSKHDKASATTFFLLGRYSNDTIYSSKSKSQLKTRIRSTYHTTLQAMPYTLSIIVWQSYDSQYCIKSKLGSHSKRKQGIFFNPLKVLFLCL